MKGSFKLVSVCFCVLLTAVSCKTIPTEMLEGEWNAVNISGEDIKLSDRSPYLGFNVKEGRLYGFNGCNRLMGSIDTHSMAKGKVDFSRMGSTMMACPDSKYEQLFTKAAAEACKVKLAADGSLLLMNSDKETVMKLTKRVFTPDVLNGEWNLVRLRGEMIEPSDETPFIGFKVAEKLLYGFTGCNRMTGTADFEKIVAGEADFGKVATTRMACADDKYESKFLQALNAAKTVKMGYETFSVLDEKGKVLMVFKKR